MRAPPAGHPADLQEVTAPSSPNPRGSGLRGDSALGCLWAGLRTLVSRPSSPLPAGQEDGPEHFNPLNTGLVSLATSLHPKSFQGPLEG